MIGNAPATFTPQKMRQPNPAGQYNYGMNYPGGYGAFLKRRPQLGTGGAEFMAKQQAASDEYWRPGSEAGKNITPAERVGYDAYMAAGGMKKGAAAWTARHKAGAAYMQQNPPTLTQMLGMQ